MEEWLPRGDQQTGTFRRNQRGIARVLVIDQSGLDFYITSVLAGASPCCMLNTDAKLLWEQFISQRKPGQSLPLEDLKRHAAKALGMKGEHVEGHLRELRHVLTNDGFKVSVTDRGIDVIAGKLSLEDAVAGKLPKSPVT